MELTIIALKQILTMLILMGVGYLCYHSKLITIEGNKALSNLCLMLVNPVVIFVSYQQDFSLPLLRGLLFSFLLALISFTISISISKIIFKKEDSPDSSIERCSVIYSNCGFIGIPLVNGMFGYEGVFYLTAYLTIYNLLIWTHGILLLNSNFSATFLKKAIFSPSIIAIFLGFIFFLLNIQLPDIIRQPLDYISGMNTPIAMLVAGFSIAQTNFLNIFCQKRIYLVTACKLLLFPLLTLGVFWFLPFSNILIASSLLASACPTGAMIILFANKYNKNDKYATELFGATTLCSMFTIPIIMFLISFR